MSFVPTHPDPDPPYPSYPYPSLPHGKGVPAWGIQQIQPLPELIKNPAFLCEHHVSLVWAENVGTVSGTVGIGKV